ncbi:30S ribosomal protein S2, partial [Shewanella sp.]
SPDGINYIIPGNDDAMRSIRLYTESVASAAKAGRGQDLAVQAEQDGFVEAE